MSSIKGPMYLNANHFCLNVLRVCELFDFKVKVKVIGYRDIYFLLSPGGRLNKKDGLTRYGNSHVKDKTS